MVPWQLTVVIVISTKKKANAQHDYMNTIMCLLLIQNEGGQQNIKFRSVDRFQPW